MSPKYFTQISSTHASLIISFFLMEIPTNILLFRLENIN